MKMHTFKVGQIELNFYLDVGEWALPLAISWWKANFGIWILCFGFSIYPRGMKGV